MATPYARILAAHLFSGMDDSQIQHVAAAVDTVVRSVIVIAILETNKSPISMAQVQGTVFSVSLRPRQQFWACSVAAAVIQTRELKRP